MKRSMTPFEFAELYDRLNKSQQRRLNWIMVWFDFRDMMRKPSLKRASMALTTFWVLCWGDTWRALLVLAFAILSSMTVLNLAR